MKVRKKEFRKTCKDNNILCNYRFLIVKDFKLFCRNNNLKCRKLIIKNYREISKVIKKFQPKKDFWDEIWDGDRELRLLEKLMHLGKPDFFVWNKEGFWFIEHKGIKDFIRPQQIKWFSLYPNLPLMILFETKSNITKYNQI